MLSFPPSPPGPSHRPDLTDISPWSGRQSSSSSSWWCREGRPRCRTQWSPPSPIGRYRSSQSFERGLQRVPVNYIYMTMSRYCKQLCTPTYPLVLSYHTDRSRVLWNTQISEIFPENSDKTLPVDKDTRTGDPKSSVKAPHSVRLDSLYVAVYDSIELSLTRRVPGVHPQSGAGVVDTLDEEQGERACAAAGDDVFCKLFLVGGVLGNFETFLNFILDKLFINVGERWENTTLMTC